MEREENSNIDISNMSKVKSASFDVTHHVGKWIEIEKIYPVKTKFGTALKIETAVLETIMDKDKSIEIRANKLFSLNDEKQIVIDGQLDKFLTKLGVEQPSDAIGKTVQVLKIERDDKTFLTF